MRNLVLIGLLSLSAVACSKDKDSCNANASIEMEKTTRVYISEVMDSGNKLLVRRDAQEVTVSESNKFVLHSGETYSFNADDSEEDDTDSVVDLENLTITASDGTTTKLKRNDFKGADWYSVDTKEMKNKLTSQMVGKQGDGAKVCSVDSINVNLNVNTVNKTILTEFSGSVGVQLDQNIVDGIKAYNGN